MSRGSSGNEPKGLRKMFQKMLMPDVGIPVAIWYTQILLHFPPFFFHHEPLGCKFKTTFFLF